MPILDERALVPLEEGDRHIPLEVIETVPAAAPSACTAGKPLRLRFQQNPPKAACWNRLKSTYRRRLG